MSKRTKGLSFEEKRKRLCEIFYESKDFYNLKELEKLGQKNKGIVAQTVKDVLQSLVDDAIVDTEKVGSSIYYWAFPSKAAQSRTRKVTELAAAVETERQKLAQLQADIAAARAERPETDERADLAAKVAEAEKEDAELQAQVAIYRENDPEVLNDRKAKAVEALAAANRWTDNVFTIQSYCSNNYGIAQADFAEQFGIPESFDYL